MFGIEDEMFVSSLGNQKDNYANYGTPKGYMD